MRAVASGISEHLTGRRLRDVLIPGRIDQDFEFPEFRPQPLALWLQLDQGLVRLTSEGQYDHIAIRLDKVADWSDIELLAEADDEIALASWMEQLFGDGWEELTWITVRGYETTDGTTSTMAIDFEGGHTLFLDPTWTFGFRIGNSADEATWIDRHSNGQTLHTIHATTAGD